jgi:hypothetical protein
MRTIVLSSYKTIITMSVLFLILVSPQPLASFPFLKTCIDINSSFYHQIIDPDILEIGNEEYWAFVIVSCEEVKRHNAFSRCANGCPLLSNGSVKFAKNKKQVCEGDVIFVGRDKCSLGKIKAKRWQPSR